jgi:hypothetical protein
MSGVGRAEARDLIRPAVDRVLASWSHGGEHDSHASE